jgi:oligoribonuclease
LARYLPDIENHLHYRSVDVSSIKELAKRWYPTASVSRPTKAGAHRALNDILESVKELAFYRASFFVASPSRDATTAPDNVANDG